MEQIRTHTNALCIAAMLLLADASAQEERLEFRAVIEGVSEVGLRDALTQVSEALDSTARPPATRQQLRRLTEDDRERFERTLRSLGYYGASASVNIDWQATPFGVMFLVEPGPPYLIERVEVIASTPDDAAPPPAPTPDELGLVKGQPAMAKAILDAEPKLLEHYRNGGYPLPEMADRKVVVDHALHTVEITYPVNLGRKAVFGATRVEGLTSVKESVVRGALEWQQGATYEKRLLDKTQKRLYDTGLFALVRVEPEGTVRDDGSLDIKIEVSERKHRTIAAGLSYRTDEGLGTRLMWEHRNMQELGRKLTLRANISETVYDVEARYLIDRFRREDQSLTFMLGAGKFDEEAYTSTRTGGSFLVQRALSKTLKAGIGAAFRYDEVEQLGETNEYYLFSTPAQVTWSRVDDELNPRDGFRLTSRIEPFIDMDGGQSTFLKGEATWRQYVPLTEDKDWLFAARLKVGVMAGESSADTPADERFYAGGGGSVRGYPYQTVGPHAREAFWESEEPVGGRSLLETSLELRRRVSKTLGLVAFLDGGTAYNAQFPDFSEDLRWGAGLGVRYYTLIGPLRLDAAVPLNKRDSDDDFQIYISIGQAF